MPVIVTCPGRCGSTTVAEYLQHKGIFMGQRFGGPSRWNDSGGLEDSDFKDPNQRLLVEEITLQQWGDQIARVLKDRVEPWGVKDPRVSDLLMIYKALFPDALWIRPRRDLQAMIDSVRRITGWSNEVSRKHVEHREEELDKHLPDAHIIEFKQIVDGSYRMLINRWLESYYPAIHDSAA